MDCAVLWIIPCLIPAHGALVETYALYLLGVHVCVRVRVYVYWCIAQVCMVGD